MRKFIFGIFAALAAAGCTPQNGYVLSGQVPEAWEGKPVVLMADDTEAPEVLDSTLVAGGKFRFRGSLDLPRRCRVVVYLDSENRHNRDLTAAFAVFLDSTAIDAVCDNSGKRPVFSLAGGATQTAYEQYAKAEELLRSDRKTAFRAYTDAYYTRKQTEEAIGLATVVDQKAQKMRDFQIGYIRENPESAISLHILRDLCGPYSPLDRQQKEELFAQLSPRVRQSQAGEELRQAIESRRITLGAPYPDLELKNEKGVPTKISDLVKPGRYTLIELWASWCAPCRAEIPFIKRAYAEYHPKGFDVVSISIDRSESDWKQALQEERLPWGQLLDDTRQSFDAYESSAVPTSLLIDPEGRICRLEARGGWLDRNLREIYGK